MTATLLPQHRQMLLDSAISEDVWTEAGVETITSRRRLLDLGFADYQCQMVPCLYFPTISVTGELVSCQIRPDAPRRNDEGDPIKYESPDGSRVYLNAHPRILAPLQDVTVDLDLTEGARKLYAAISQGRCCLSLPGVWGFRVAKKLDPKQPPLPDWDHIPLQGRRVNICFDSDVMTKPGVHQALRKLITFLKSRGADVWIIYLPDTDEGDKQGLDDFLAAGHTAADVLALAEKKLRPPVCAPQTALVESLKKRLRGLADVSANRLALSQEISEEGLRKVGRAIHDLHKEVEGPFEWWLGDFYRNAEFPHGSKVASFETVLGKHLAKKAQKAATVVGDFPPARRRAGILEFWPYQEIAGMNRDAQEAMLDWYEEARPTRSQFREAMGRPADGENSHTATQRPEGNARPTVVIPSILERLTQTLPAALASDLAHVLEVFGTEELEAWIEQKKAQMQPPNVPPAEHLDEDEEREEETEIEISEIAAEGEEEAPASITVESDNLFSPPPIIIDSEQFDRQSEFSEAEGFPNVPPAEHLDESSGPVCTDCALLREQVRAAWREAELPATPELLSKILHRPITSVRAAFQEASSDDLCRLLTYGRTGNILPPGTPVTAEGASP